MLKVLGVLLAAGWAALFLFVMPLCGCYTRTPGFSSALKSDMRNLESQQEIYFDEHGTYSRDLGELRYVSSEGVSVELLHADSAGWAAEGSHSWFTDYREQPYHGMNCVAARGTGLTKVRTAIKGRSPSEDRPVACDLDGWHHRQSRWERWRWQWSD